MPYWRGEPTDVPSSGTSQIHLPGMRFGMLSEADTPKTSPVDLHLEADVPKREAIREAFKVGLEESHADVTVELGLVRLALFSASTDQQRSVLWAPMSCTQSLAKAQT